MINLFGNRKPRGFHHEYMFVDERKDKLNDIERRAKAQLGQTAEPQYTAERMRGTFLNATKYARRRRERRLSGGLILNTTLAVLLLIVLLVVWRLLLM